LKKEKSRSVNLCVPQVLVDRLNQEIEFLNLDSRVVEVDETRIKNKSAFVRHLCDRYALAALNGTGKELVELDEEGSGVIPLYLNRQSEGIWNSAIRGGAAPNYNRLAESALYHYFANQEAAAESLNQKLVKLKAAMVRAVPAELEAIVS
jgi:hypothetical protein